MIYILKYRAQHILVWNNAPPHIGKPPHNRRLSPTDALILRSTYYDTLFNLTSLILFLVSMFHRLIFLHSHVSYTLLNTSVSYTKTEFGRRNIQYTRCNRRNGPDFGRVFLRSNYTDITQNTHIQSSMVTEILAREVWNIDSYYSLIDYQIHIETGRNMWFL